MNKKLLLLLAISVVVVQGLKIPDVPSAIMILTDANYNQTISGSKHVMVDFNTHWW